MEEHIADRDLGDETQRSFTDIDREFNDMFTTRSFWINSFPGLYNEIVGSRDGAAVREEELNAHNRQ